MFIYGKQKNTLRKPTYQLLKSLMHLTSATGFHKTLYEAAEDTSSLGISLDLQCQV